jgi:hypothetical protein
MYALTSQSAVPLAKLRGVHHWWPNATRASSERANEGANMQGKNELVQELNQYLFYDQCRHRLRRTLLKGDATIIKSKQVVAQQTTTK